MNFFIKNIEKINSTISKDIEQNIKNDKLKEAIHYSLSEGKRWRPIIFLSIFETSTIDINKYSSLDNFYLFLEYIHNASLILDDMPMMDNDEFRRNKLTLHKKFNESTSKLAALQLLLLAQYHITNTISQLYNDGYFESLEELKLFSEKLNKIIYDYLGNEGLCLGQFIDLNMSDEEKDISKWHLMVNKKTSSLFILSFLLGFIFSRKSLDNLEDIKKIGEYFGYIYQILDDIEDYEIDKSKKYNNNILFYISKSESNELVKKYYKEMISLINKNKIGCSTLKNICKLLKSKWLKTKTI